LLCAWPPFNYWRIERLLSAKATQLVESHRARVYCNTIFDSVALATIAAGRDARQPVVTPRRHRTSRLRPVDRRLPGPGSGSFPGILACQYHFAARRSSPRGLERPDEEKETS
jgi:hypothetical protein